MSWNLGIPPGEGIHQAIIAGTLDGTPASPLEHHRAKNSLGVSLGGVLPCFNLDRLIHNRAPKVFDFESQAKLVQNRTLIESVVIDCDVYS